jgi:hypothetical protein
MCTAPPSHTRPPPPPQPITPPTRPLPQLAHPYYIFKAHSLDVTVSSIRGGEIPVDEASLGAPFLTPEVEKFLLDGGGRGREAPAGA